MLSTRALSIGTRRATLAWVGLGALLVAACSTVHEAPLPVTGALSAESLESPRLWVRATELKHPAVSAVKVDLSNGVSPDEAAVLAVLRDPQLVAVRSEHGVGEAQVLAAGILPNPAVDVELSQPYGDNSQGTTTAFDVSLSMATRSLISRAARYSAAEASLAEIDLGIAWQEWQVAERARLLTVRLGWLRRRLRLAREELTFEEHTAQALEEASAAGNATIEQVGIQRAALESVRGTVDDLEQSESTTESDLLTLLAAPERERLEVSEPSEPASPPAPSPAAVDVCVAQRLDMQALERGYAASEGRIRQAVLEQFPSLSVGVRYQRDEAELQFVGGFVSLELPLFDRNQGNVAVERATRQMLRQEYSARVAAVRASLAQLSRLVLLVGRQLPEVQASIGPLERIERAERDAVARGDIDRLSYQTVRSALLDQRLHQASLSQALAEARVGLESACGGPLRSSVEGSMP